MLTTSEFDTAATRLWLRVDKSGGPTACWPWTGPVNNAGYGRIATGRRGNTRRHYGVHQLALMLDSGEPLGGRYVLHSCDNPRCCNPTHLSFGSHQDNMTDMVRKGRGFVDAKRHVGMNHGRAKLTDDDIRHIRVALDRITELASQYGVSKSLISQIRLGRIWKHVV